MKPNKNVNDQKNLKFLSKLKKGQTVEINNLEIKEGETSPPKRYTSGTIILAMENAGKLIEDEELRGHIKGSGIGTSATRAEILKKLEKIEYIKSNNKTQILTPTVKGEFIYEVVKDSIPSLLNPKLTASWEKGLKMVVDKEIKSETFMDKLENYIKNNSKKVLSRNSIIDVNRLFSKAIKGNNLKIDESKSNDVLGICPLCKNGQVVKNSKGFGCNNWKNGCNFFVGNVAGVQIPTEQIKKLIKNGKTDIINGFKSKKGNNFDARLAIKNGKVEFSFD